MRKILFTERYVIVPYIVIGGEIDLPYIYWKKMLCAIDQKCSLVLGCELLTNLHEHFTTLMKKNDIPMLSFGEGVKLDLPPFNYKTMVVPPESSSK